MGAKRGGKCIGIYIDDERQSSRPPGPRPAGLAANAPSAASPRFKGSTDPVFTAASCIWSVCRQSTLICRRDRALASFIGHVCMVRGRAKINSYFTAREFWPPARRERRAYPARGSVRSEQRSPRPKEPAGKCEVVFARPLSYEQYLSALKINQYDYTGTPFFAFNTRLQKRLLHRLNL